jgi:hypothetical protein
MPRRARNPASGGCGAEQDASTDHFMLRGILTDHEHAGRAVKATSVEHRSPLVSEVCRRLHRRTGVRAAQRREWFGVRTGIERDRRHRGNSGVNIRS